MSDGQKLMLTVCAIVIALLVLAAFGYWSGRWELPPE